MKAQFYCLFLLYLKVGDTAIKPVSGHILRVKAPWITTMMAYTKNKVPAYIIPK